MCTLIEELFDDPNWIFEPKLDGLRLLCKFDGKTVQLISRNGKLQNLQFPEIVNALKKDLKKPAVVDGELVSIDQNGNSNFSGSCCARRHCVDVNPRK